MNEWERERIESLTERHAAFQAINFCNSFCVDMDCLLNRMRVWWWVNNNRGEAWRKRITFFPLWGSRIFWRCSYLRGDVCYPSLWFCVCYFFNCLVWAFLSCRSIFNSNIVTLHQFSLQGRVCVCDVVCFSLFSSPSSSQNFEKSVL